MDFPRLWQHVTGEFACSAYSVHGPDHWKRVERNGLLIARHNGAVEEVVRLFALFHDARRENDGGDKDHGPRAAEYALRLRGRLFDLSNEEFDLLSYACTWHTHGRLTEDPTIGACWDADRLDLGRVGIRPSAQFMSTMIGCEIASHRSVEQYIERTQSF